MIGSKYIQKEVETFPCLTEKAKERKKPNKPFAIMKLKVAMKCMALRQELIKTDQY